MIRLALRTFADRWQLFVGTVLAVTAGVAIVHAGLTIILGVEDADAPTGLTPEQAEAFRLAAADGSELTGIALMIGIFLTIFVVGSTFGFAVDQRRGDLAILRLGGVTRRQIRRLLLGEAFLAALLGALAGALLGTVLTTVQRFLLSRLGFFPEDLATPVQPAVLVIDLIAALTVCLAGARGAAKSATKVSPLDALRRSSGERRVMTLGRWIVAITALALTALQAYFSATAGGLLVPLLLGLGIIMTGSVAMSRLSPLLVPAAALALTPWSRRSPVAGLAVANLRDAVRRTASGAAPMIVLVSLVMGLQGIVNTQTESGAATLIFDADLIATGEDIDVSALENINGISLASPETVVPLSVQLTTGGATTTGPGTVVAVDPDAFNATHLQQPDSGRVADFGPDSLIFGPGLESTIDGAYDQITVKIDGRTLVLSEAARMSATPTGTDGYYIDRSLLPADLLQGPTTFLVQLAPGVETAVVESALTAAGASTVQTPAEFTEEQNRANAAGNRAVMVMIVGLGSLYALISVLSTLAISISQRRSELATLRLSGLTRRQIQHSTIIEALAVTTIGLILGAVAAVLSLVGLWASTYRLYGAPVIAIPWTLLGVITLLVATLTTITALLATRAAMKVPAIRALGAHE
ncbi:ABC transporter permease [Arthrobacter sp. MSA 4-2]|uniref:ABC transporter permease n=1 Tax=Arthrobacter sp. MSA 4-2 TaxID=2794349 RepID=UPI0018E77F3F|nr:ABC transporter permease [Arthrobacter sp. MSA 4-2]MBJ2122612.1 ABC transporter permease [Arthrobacter sp. MSA 4-2]